MLCGLVGSFLTSGPLFAQSVLPPAEVRDADIPIVLLVDASNDQVLYSHNASRRFVPASVTKAMTLYTAFELIDEGQLDLRQSLTVSPEIWMEWRAKGSRMFLNADDLVSLPNILTGIATVSANDASIVLAEGAAGSVSAWTSLMNAKARGLGMVGSHFATPNGWPDEGQTFTTAQDLVLLGKALFEKHPEKSAQFIGQSEFRYNSITQSNHDPMIGRVVGADGIKTGYTNEAGFSFLGTAKRGDQRLILVIAGANRNAQRARAARSLVEWGFSAFARKTLYAKGAAVGSARVQNGSARSVQLVADRAIAVNLPEGKSDELRLTISYNGPLRAPIAAGDRVATLEISAPDMEPARIPLMARRSIAKAGFFARITNALAGWFS